MTPDCHNAPTELELARAEIARLNTGLQLSLHESARLKVKINSMLEILSEELTRAARRRVGSRFNAELENKTIAELTR